MNIPEEISDFELTYDVMFWVKHRGNKFSISLTPYNLYMLFKIEGITPNMYDDNYNFKYHFNKAILINTNAILTTMYYNMGMDNISPLICNVKQ
jgi:hypothetical protein